MEILIDLAPSTLSDSLKHEDSLQEYSSMNKDLLDSYNEARTADSNAHLCNAPFASMYFRIDGKITACCLNSTHELGRYPENSIEEAWNGDQVKKLRQLIKNNDLSSGCHSCKRHLETKNFTAITARTFDNLPIHADYPSKMEFALANTCNLECVMCDGYASSSIRKNREKKSPIISPYDDAFVEQLEEYIPHLLEAKFYGGEPFLTDINYQIWERIVEVNPGCKIDVQTNATILNNRVKDLLRRGNFNIGVSIDSLQKVNYENIRVNASFDQVMENMAYFQSYCSEKGTSFGIAMCIMQQNWREIPDFINYCNERNIYIYFNTVWYPAHSSLCMLETKELDEIHQYLLEIQLPTDNDIQRANRKKYEDEIQMIGFWHQNAKKQDAYNDDPESLDPKNIKADIIKKIEFYFQNRGNLNESEREIKIATCRDKFENVLKMMGDESAMPMIYLLVQRLGIEQLIAALERETPDTLYMHAVNLLQQPIID